MYIYIYAFAPVYIYIYSYIYVYIYKYLCISDMYKYVYICVYIGSFFGTFSLPLGTLIYMHKNMSLYSFVNIYIAPQGAHYHASVNCWTSAQKSHNMPASCHVLVPGASKPEHESRTVKLGTRSPKPEI